MAAEEEKEDDDDGVDNKTLFGNDFSKARLMATLRSSLSTSSSSREIFPTAQGFDPFGFEFVLES